MERIFVFKKQNLLLMFGVILLFAVSAIAGSGDLVSPVMTNEKPAAGKRVRQVAPEYKGTDVYHSLYLPVDWKQGGKYPVIVEYTGNKFPPGKGSGAVKDANLGYGMSGGQGFIWVSMPYVEKGRNKNAVKWWGDKQATVDYCKVNLPRICKKFGGDPNNVFICGFSRGAIGASYIGLALVFFGYAVVQHRPTLYALYCIDNLIFFGGIALTTYLHKIAPPEDLKPTLSMGVTMNHFAAVAAPLIGGFAWHMFGYQVIFFSGSALAVISLLVTQWVNPERQLALEAEQETSAIAQPAAEAAT